ncbi:MAG: type IX secretion system outer membrane channel protein PorV [Cyclobacteriaceae bacterium]
MYMKFKLFIVCLGLCVTFASHAQIRISQLGGSSNPITVAVPFLSFSPDSRGSAMGDVGVATDPSPYSVHWNNSKLAFVEDDMAFSFSYSPWLGNIVDDMSLNYLTFYKRIDPIQTFGVTMRYFDLGEIQLTDNTGQSIGLENPREAAIDATYARKLTENLSAGLSMRFIWSNLAGSITGGQSADAGTSLAFDMGVYYRKPLVVGGLNSQLSLGTHLSNIGQKISYTTEEFEDFIPGNLRLGTAFKINLDSYNVINLAIDVNKLMVPTPPEYDLDTRQIIRGKDPDRPFLSGTFGSFGDAPNGPSEEFQELMYSFGIEYVYNNIFAVRTGYFLEHENKGDRKFFTIGMGFKYQVFGIDISYLIPQVQGHPLGDTLRLSLKFNMQKQQEGDL